MYFLGIALTVALALVSFIAGAYIIHVAREQRPQLKYHWVLWIGGALLIIEALSSAMNLIMR